MKLQKNKLEYKNNIRVKLLRDYKTDALLIYIKTMLDEILQNISNQTYEISLGFKEFNKDILKNIKFLSNNLNQILIDINQLKLILKHKQDKYPDNRLPPADEALIYYFNNIIKEVEFNLKDGDLWIPEQVIFSLLSEWLIEEEKSADLYPFLNEVDYTKLLSYYEIARNHDVDVVFKEKTIDMFYISNCIIKKLKESKYKINTSRKSKKRVKKR